MLDWIFKSRDLDECPAVLKSPDFLRLNLFEVMSVDVVPELPEKDLVAVVLDVGLLIGNLEIGSELREEEQKSIAKAINSKSYLNSSSLKWKLQSLEFTRINF